MKTRRIKEDIEKLKEQNQKLKEKTKKIQEDFNTTLKNSFQTAIVTAFTLVIALQWNTLISSFVTSLSAESPIKNSFITAIGVTIFCVLGIFLTTRILSAKKSN